MGRKLSFDILHSNIFDYIEFAPNYSLIEISVSPEIIGKTISELSWNKIKINIIAIKRNGVLNLNPGANQEIHRDDTLLVMGENDDLEKLQQTILNE
ncbi:MAG: TrkA C-terminal domain-containing protein [Bacillota bacterium]